MTAPASELIVVASGMLTGVGYNAPATLAALRAGVSGIRSLTWPDPESGKRVRCARVWLPQRHAGTELLVDLLAPAVDECFIAADRFDTENIPLLLGVAQSVRRGRPAGVEQDLLRQIYQRIDAPACAASRIYPGDQSGCAFALLEARRLLAGGYADRVLIGGVDSLLERRTIMAYAEARRLLTPANFNGFLPGEAGSAVMIASAPGETGGLRIVGIGHGEEPATIEDTKALRGNALTSAIRTALASADVTMPQVNFRVTDLSGEHYKFKEAMFAALRLDQAPRKLPFQMWHPVEFLGEIRAAILPCLLAWTWDAFRRGYAPGPEALIHLGSDDGHRFAFAARAA